MVDGADTNAGGRAQGQPPQHPEPEHPPPRTRTGEIIREATGAGRFLAGLTAGQVQSFAQIFMTFFVCALGGWIVYRWDMSVQTDKTREDKSREAMVRESNAQAELTRQHCARMEDSRAARDANLLKDMQNANHTHQASEGAKARAHESERDKEWFRVVMQIQAAWSAFGVEFADLKRLLKAKVNEP